MQNARRQINNGQDAASDAARFDKAGTSLAARGLALNAQAGNLHA
jgi:hypothetical protein